MKSHTRLVREYNTRVEFHNNLAAEDREIIDEYNRTTSQTEADKLEAVHNKLVELIEQQQDKLNDIQTEIYGLAVKLQ
jgi:hypothetical protein